MTEVPPDISRLVPKFPFGNALSLEILFPLPIARLTWHDLLSYLILMRSRYTIIESEGIYFLTATIVSWLPVLIGDDACRLIRDSLSFCRKNKSLRLYAYVIMENHVHLVAEAPELSGCMQSFKQYTARGLITQAKTAGAAWQLHQYDYCKKAYKDRSRFQV